MPEESHPHCTRNRRKMLVQHVTEFQRAISQDRLDAYRLPALDDHHTLANYLWNIALSEALYPVLEAFEVSLRNAIHTAATAHFNTSWWFNNANILPLQQRERKTLNDTFRNLSSHLAKQGKTLTPGRVVAELSFGFWTGLLNRPYERYLWSFRRGGANLMNAVVPNAPTSPINYQWRMHFEPYVDKIRRLRNRVFHYEPIWNWSNPDVPAQHAEILDAIGWISVDAQRMIRMLDRFPAIYQQGYSVYLPAVRQAFP